MSAARRKSAGNAAGQRRVCGFHAVESALARNPDDIVSVSMDQRRDDPRSRQLRQALVTAGIDCHLADREELDRLGAGVRHQGVVAIVRGQAQKPEASLWETLDTLNNPALLLVLDQVQDPHNLGAILRVADGAGVNAVILPKDGACPVNETVSRVAAGAVESVPIYYVSNLARTLDTLRERGVWITGTADEADVDFYQGDFTADVAIVMGAEGRGMRRLTRERCDYLVRIPMAGAVSSLNVSVAAGLLLYEVVRQRRPVMKTDRQT